jgi:hypothetical protein
MQNNVGIYASQISGHLWAPNGAMDALSTVNVPSGGLASIAFSGIPSGYKHLQLRILYGNWTSSNGDVKMRFNLDSSSNYSRHGLYGNGANAVAYGLANETYIGAGYLVNGGYVSTVIIDVLDYASITKYKTTRTLEGRDRNGSGDVALSSGSWRNTSAVSTIELTPPTGNFPQYSQFALYGVK